VHPCNFRYAGRLSNENARTLTTLHEKFAISATTSLELYLGTTLQVKLVSVEQMPIADYVSGISATSYLLPCPLNVMESNFLMELDASLISPIIDLLLGGEATTESQARELTEIDEEIMQSVTTLLVRELERTWRTLNLSLTPGRCIKAGLIQQVFLVNEKLVLLIFEMSIGETAGFLKVVLPSSFVGFLLRHLIAAQSKKLSILRPARNMSIRERIIDSEFIVSADITQMRVLVRDLIELKPGMILKTKTPVKRAGRLTVEGVEMFEALPVRNGGRKAMQLSACLQEPDATKE
jgi:flagellar motor switch protein FliM